MATRKRIKGQTIQWPQDRQYNGHKDRQYNGHKENNKRTDNTMATRKRIKGQTIQWPQGKQ